MSNLKTSSANSLFTAKDIAEPLASVTVNQEEELSSFFNHDNFDVVGFNENGRIAGFLEKQEIDSFEEMSNKVKRFEIHDLITANTDLKDCLSMLESRQQLFIMDKSYVSDIVTQADREKPAVRMMLFGVITVFESELASLINRKYPNDGWKRHLKPFRIEKAKEEYEKLVAKNLEINLINCTQICDKTDIVVNDPELLESLTGLSKKQATKNFKQVQNLRDDLAHAQSLQNWFEDNNVMTLINKISSTTDKIKEQHR